MGSWKNASVRFPGRSVYRWSLRCLSTNLLAHKTRMLSQPSASNGVHTCSYLSTPCTPSPYPTINSVAFNVFNIRDAFPKAEQLLVVCQPINTQRLSSRDPRLSGLTWKNRDDKIVDFFDYIWKMRRPRVNSCECVGKRRR